jgi:enoyl-CoA hydratase/carnithine racemase
VDEEAGALVARIDNSARANALDDAVLEALVSLLDGPRAAAARVVLLAGSGDRHFSSGLDLGGHPPDAIAARLRGGERMLSTAARAIADCRRPVIAVLNGAAFGGALELAMACDWRIARTGVRLGMPATRIGVVYAPDGLRRFVAALGPARARRLFLTGAPVGAEEAYALGLVDQLVAPEELWPAARAAAADVATAAPLAVEGTRAIVRAMSDGPMAAGPEAAAAEWRRRAFASDDFREGLRAFREKRPPRFEGR